jgi:hypothetical protein
LTAVRLAGNDWAARALRFAGQFAPRMACASSESPGQPLTPLVDVEPTPESRLPSPTLPPRRRRNPRRLRRRRARLRRVGIVTGALALLLLAVVGWYVWTLRTDYRAVKANIAVARAMAPSESSGQRLRPDQLAQLSDRLALIDAQLQHLQDRLHVPVLTPIARHTPWVGARVRAVDDFLEFGLAASALGHDSAQLGRDIYAAWQQTGLSGPADPNAPTWLGVVQHNRADIDSLLARFDALLAQRNALDVERLPAQATHMLASIDPLLNRVAQARDRYAGLLDYYPVLAQALGAGEGAPLGAAPRDTRYLVLLLNSEEIRPSGGFPGTYAVVTVNQGRLVSYEFHNILELDAAYLARRTTPLPPPGPLAEYLKVQEWLPRDSGWSADFPEAARTLLTMYTVAGGEPVDGVAAITDDAVRDLLRTLGPLTVTIDGEQVTVDADNIIDVIESYRAGPGERHKAAVGVIGTALLDRIRNGGFDLQKLVLNSIRASADRREIQLYATDPTLESQVAAKGWDGALVPDATVPTLGLTLANIVGNKASNQLFVATDLRFAQTATGVTHVTWTIDIAHHGDPLGDELYNGFHRTWLAVYLPAGATLVRSTPTPESPPVSDDTRALGYQVALLPEDMQELRLTFDLPADTHSVRLRRQPGANSIDIAVQGATATCPFDSLVTLDRDVLLDLESCSATPASVTGP